MMNVAGTRDDGRDGDRFARLWPLLAMIFLPNLGAPLAELLHASPAPPRLGAILAGLTLFVTLYLWASWHNDLSRVIYPAPQQGASGRWRWLPVAVLVGLSVVLILGDGERWLSLLIFTSACAGGRFAPSRAVRIVVALAVLTGLLGWLVRDPLSELGSAAFWTGMAGILTVIITHFRRTNRALRVAREKNARLAVEAERLRFARDLHDLLGHDLARIALQSEVVEALVPTDPGRAIATAREMGQAARTALQEVRAAVTGYRQPALASELRGAGEILAAAGIAYRREGETLSTPPAVEATLAWAVREGVTNVVKHSRARHCTIRTTGDVSYAGVEVSDDGPGPGVNGTSSPAPSSGGSGLPGLAERVAVFGGSCDAGPRPGGGFRLVVTLPIEKNGAGATAEQAAAQTRAGAATSTGARGLR